MMLHLDRASMYVAFPARVVSYDAAKQVAVVEPMTKNVSRNADEDRIVDTLPIMPGIPVAWPRGGGYFFHFPLVSGDSGLVVVTDTDIGAWRESGQVSDPGDEGRHELGGATFYPGLETVARALTGLPDHLIIGKEGGAAAIHLDGSLVNLGDTGGQFVALANLVMARLNQIQAAFDVHTHATAAVGSPSPPTGAGIPIGTLGDVSATLVKAL